MQESAERDPYRILLNMTWFRGMFHIYEIVQEIEGTADGRVYVVRKQLLSHGLMHFMRGVDQDEKYTEVRVTRDDLVHVYDTLRHTSVPAYRTAGVGKDGSWYALQIGTRPCSTTIRWWSDTERELEPVYKLRDTIVKTVKKIIRTAK